MPTWDLKVKKALVLEVVIASSQNLLLEGQRLICLQFQPGSSTSLLLARYVQAWETDDVAGLVALLKEDATLSMPPSWFWGRAAIGAILTSTVFGSVPKKWRLFPTQANAQPAFALYRADESSGCYQAFGIQVVTLDRSAPNSHIVEVTIFNVPSLVTSFGFPLQWPE